MQTQAALASSRSMYSTARRPRRMYASPAAQKAAAALMEKNIAEKKKVPALGRRRSGGLMFTPLGVGAAGVHCGVVAMDAFGPGVTVEWAKFRRNSAV